MPDMGPVSVYVECQLKYFTIMVYYANFHCYHCSNLVIVYGPLLCLGLASMSIIGVLTLDSALLLASREPSQLASISIPVWNSTLVNSLLWFQP